MSKELVGIVHNTTNEMIFVKSAFEKLELADKLNAHNEDILGEVISIEQYHYSKDLGLRSFIIRYKLPDGTMFERFVDSNQYSPLLQRNMKPFFKVADTIIKRSNLSTNLTENRKNACVVSDILDSQYKLYTPYNNDSFFVDIDEVNELYASYEL